MALLRAREGRFELLAPRTGVVLGTAEIVAAQLKGRPALIRLSPFWVSVKVATGITTTMSHQLG